MILNYMNVSPTRTINDEERRSRAPVRVIVSLWFCH